MKENLSISTQTKISLKAFKPEENIYDIFPTEKFNKSLSKRKFNSSEFSSNISYIIQSNIKSNNKYNNNKEKENLPSINFNSNSLLQKYLNKKQNFKIKNFKQILSNLNYVYFPFNPYIQKNKTFSLETIVNSNHLLKEIEINQELYNKLLYYDILSKKIGKKEINLISEYIVDKINIKNCIIIPPHFIIHNKFVNLLMGKIDKVIEKKVKQNISINYEYANNFVKKEIDNIKHKIKLGIKKFKNKDKNINENHLINNFQFSKTHYKSMNSSNTFVMNNNDDKDIKENLKKKFLKGKNYLEYEDTDSDKLSLSSIIDDKNTISQYIQSKMKDNNFNNESSFLINYYDEDGNIIEINENNPLILYDKEGNQVTHINLKNDTTYYNKDGKPVFISIQNNFLNINKNNNCNSIHRKNKLNERNYSDSQDLLKYNLNLKSSDNFDILFNKNTNYNLEDNNSNEGKVNNIIEIKDKIKKININKNINDIIKKLPINKRNIIKKHYNITESKKIKSQDFSYSNINNIINNNFLKKKINSITSRNIITNEETEMSREKEIKKKSDNKLQRINQIVISKISEKQKQIYEKKNNIKLDKNLKNNLTMKKLPNQTKYDLNIIKILQLKEQRNNLGINSFLLNENKTKKKNKINSEDLMNNNLNLKTKEIQKLNNNEEKKNDLNLKNDNLKNIINKDENKEQNYYNIKTDNDERNSNSFFYKNNSIIFSNIDNKKGKNKQKKFYRKLYLNNHLKCNKITKINRLKNRIENDLNDLEYDNLQIKNKKTSRSVYEKKLDNKSSLNQLIDKKKSYEKENNNELCSLIDIQFDNLEFSKNKPKRQRNYHKILSEKLFLKTSSKSINKNIKKDNNINIIN